MEKQMTDIMKMKLQGARELYDMGIYTCTEYENRRDVLLEGK